MNSAFLILLLSTMVTHGVSTTLIIMGPSCAGKSTVAKKVFAALNSKKQPWKIIEVDDIEEQYNEKQIAYTYDGIIIAAVKETNGGIADGKNIIFVTNVYSPYLHNITSQKKWVLVTCPLEKLLERDDKRAINLGRSEQKQYWAREYVKESFNEFEKIADYDVCVDSSKNSPAECCTKIIAACTLP